MTNYTESDIQSLTGKDLLRAVRLLKFGDDGSCFNPDGTERVERIAEAIRNSQVSSALAGFLSGSIPTVSPTVTYTWNNQKWRVDAFRTLYARDEPGFRQFSRSIKQTLEVLWYWDNREGQPYQSDLESHVRNWRAEPREITDEELDEMTKETITYHLHGRWRVVDLVGQFIATGSSSREARLRAVCIQAIREGK